MANQTWLELSLRRVALLGSEVLERASRRSVDWTDTSLTVQRTLTTDQEDGQNPLERTRRSTNLDEAFETIGAFMAQTAHHCMNVHGPDRCSEPSGAERTHVSRFHTHRAAGRTTPRSPPRTEDRSSPREDFHVEVSPGSYTITAGVPDAPQRTQRVSLLAGDSVTLNFDLSPLS